MSFLADMVFDITIAGRRLDIVKSVNGK